MKIFKKFRILMPFAMLSASFSLYAQSDDELEELGMSYGSESFISIATGRSKPINKAPAVASVITAEQIEAMGARTIDEVLETVSGLHVSDSSTRLSPLYSIRGIHTDKNPQVLMLMDGVALTQLYFGDRGPVSSLPVNAIDRIEIIRGPGSAVYGADAFSGVINIITKTADDYDGVKVGGRLAEFGTRDFWMAYGGYNPDGVSTAINIQLSNIDGDDGRIAKDDAQSFFDAELGSSASYAPGSLDTNMSRADINASIVYENWTARLWGRYVDSVGSGPGVALALDPEGSAATTDYLVEVVKENLVKTDDMNVDLRLNYYSVDSVSNSTLFPAGTVLPIDSIGNINPVSGVPILFPDGLIGNPSVLEKRSNIELVGFYDGMESHDIRTSIGATHSTLKPGEEKNYGPGVPVGVLTNVTGTEWVYIKTKSRDLFYISLQDEINIAADWELTLGVRYDQYSDFGATTNPRMALVWETQRNLTTKLLYGQAFRAPSFAELYAINNPVILGNEGLSPEIINTFEVVFDYSYSQKHHINLSLYNYNVSDLIQFVTDSSGASTAQNTGEQSGRGMEIEWNWNPEESLVLRGSVSIAKATDDEKDVTVADYPEQHAYIDINWEFLPGWKIVPQINYVGSRNRAENDPREDISDYTIFNLALNSTNKSTDFKWGVGIKNVFDRKHYEPSPYQPNVPSGSFMPGDFQREGRQFYLQGVFKF
jgi:iron complex outermembrane receptor protein